MVENPTMAENLKNARKKIQKTEENKKWKKIRK